jgi:hypothetical protein
MSDLTNTYFMHCCCWAMRCCRRDRGRRSLSSTVVTFHTYLHFTRYFHGVLLGVACLYVTCLVIMGLATPIFISQIAHPRPIVSCIILQRAPHSFTHFFIFRLRGSPCHPAVGSFETSTTIVPCASPPQQSTKS